MHNNYIAISAVQSGQNMAMYVVSSYVGVGNPPPTYGVLALHTVIILVTSFLECSSSYLYD